MFLTPILGAFAILGTASAFHVDLSSGRTLLIQLLLYVAFDYAHTYAILFRTYFDSATRKNYRIHLIATPIAVFALGLYLYSISLFAFWTFFGYLQTFHFVRQQYGWMKLSEKKFIISRWDRHLNTAVIYVCTIYPIIYWHTYLLEKFYWYKNMLTPPAIPPIIEQTAWVLFLTINTLFIARTLWQYFVDNVFYAGRFLVYLLTFCIWYIGLVQLEVSIISFAAFNTLGHGFPYIVLIYRYVKRNWKPDTYVARLVLKPYGFLPYYLFLILIAYVETYFQFTYQERNYEMAFFGSFQELSSSTLMWLVPLMMIPQATHSVLDGFIWRFNSSRDPQLLTKLRD